MFTGLIQAVGKLISSTPQSGGRKLVIDISGLESSPTIGDSIAINGVCLTVTSTDGKSASFDAVEETVTRSSLALKHPGAELNLEPALKVGSRLDGHFVLGHVDATSKITGINYSGSGQIWKFSLPPQLSALVAEKGSITIDGISLTVASIEESFFTVSLIPHTIENTALRSAAPGDIINLEIDVLARYIARQLNKTSGNVSEELLRENGFI